MNDQNENAYAEEGDTEQTGVSRNTMYIALAVVAAVVVIGILIAVMFSGSDDSSEPIVVPADSDPIKDMPDPPEVKKADTEDLDIYKRINDGEDTLANAGSMEPSDNIDVPGLLDTTGMDMEPLDGYWQRSLDARGINPNGRFVLQLASYLSYDDADNAWKKLRAATPSRYDDIQKIIERADLGRRGVFYRLRVGAFDTMKAAEDYCDALERQRSDCWITNR